jgi:glycine dehydrogenase subunit 1
MLSAIGVNHIDDLIAHIPAEARLNRPLSIAPGKSEFDIVDYFRERGDRGGNGFASFLGAGVYRHFRPVVADVIVQRSEFLTSYTPYQAEIAQGTLTQIFEFQTMVCQLTGMEVANASMYDGSTAVPEAAMMAVRITGRNKTLVARTVHPEYREVLDTYTKHQGMPVAELGYDSETGRLDMADLAAKIDSDTACVIIQSPNFFGTVEELDALAELVHAKGALLVYVFTEAISLGLLQPPSQADIVVGELQSFCISPVYGGPFAGIIATKEKFIRQIPGRLVGETKDTEGRRAFCLTLSTREQHIRREKATSNICTNQALIALMGTVYLSLFGKEGLRELAVQNLSKAHYLGSQLKPRFSGAYFNEFVTRVGDPEALNAQLLEEKIIGGLPLGKHYPELADSMLLCATEMTKKPEMDKLVAVAGRSK